MLQQIDLDTLKNLLALLDQNVSEQLLFRLSTLCVLSETSSSMKQLISHFVLQNLTNDVSGDCASVCLENVLLGSTFGEDYKVSTAIGFLKIIEKRALNQDTTDIFRVRLLNIFEQFVRLLNSQYIQFLQNKQHNS